MARDLPGRVVDVFGAPVPGAAVTLHRRTRHVRVGDAYEWVDEESLAPVLTQADGLFRLPTVPLEGPRLRIEGPGIAPLHVTLDDTSTDAPRTFVVRSRTHLRVELTMEDTGIDEARLFDANGELLDVGILRGTELELARSAAFFLDRTHLLVVPGSAAFLALYAGGTEVHRAPLALELGELNLLSLIHI